MQESKELTLAEEQMSADMIEELEIERDIDLQEEIDEPKVIDSVLLNAGINPHRSYDDCDENERYYEHYLI
jgi:hypothetical protein